METLTLTTPEQTPAITTTDYRVIYLSMDWERALIVIHLRGTNGERKQADYSGSTATTLMTQLNKLDLSVKSLHKRILERLVADGKLSGSVTGAPD